MNETLRDFIDRRLRELDDLERPLLVQLDEIRKERAALKKSARVIGEILPVGISAKSRQTGDEQTRTIKEIVLQILSERSGGLAASDILTELKSRTGVSYERTSLSPQLSRLKRERKLTKDGIVWLLRK
jgi:hypothetical protein